jgi:4-hydroxy-3-methylbut-2-enyl diphosphate reductase
MLATETKAIADLLREAIIDRYGEAEVEEHFADTSDTLCYATYENQDATKALIEDGGDVAIVVGGYNSSNTSHLVELCAEHMPTYFIRGAGEIESSTAINHYDVEQKEVVTTEHWFPDTSGDEPVDVVLTSGASCPDALLDEVVRKLVAWFPDAQPVDEALAPYEAMLEEDDDE